LDFKMPGASRFNKTRACPPLNYNLQQKKLSALLPEDAGCVTVLQDHIPFPLTLKEKT